MTKLTIHIEDEGKDEASKVVEAREGKERKHKVGKSESKPTREGRVVGPEAIGRDVLVVRIADGEEYIATYLGETKTGLARVKPTDENDCGGTDPTRPRAVSMHAIDKVF